MGRRDNPSVSLAADTSPYRGGIAGDHEGRPYGGTGERKTCFGSFFVCHPKDKDLYKISINYKDIKWIFKRKYYYNNSALEIFTTTNKTFYFNFKYEKNREEVLKEILRVKLQDENENFYYKRFNAADVKIIRDNKRKTSNDEDTTEEELAELKRIEAMDKYDNKNRTKDDDV